jgi:uncharacterized protein YbjQ (UPF0145 family)
MILSTTPTIEGKTVRRYLGLVSGDAGEMCEQARQLGANAIVGINLDYETIGANGSMLMVSAGGTAVIID